VTNSSFDEPTGNVSQRVSARVEGNHTNGILKRERYLSSSIVASRLGVSARTIRLWAECGELPAVKFGRQWRFVERILMDWISERAEQTMDPRTPKYSRRDGAATLSEPVLTEFSREKKTVAPSAIAATTANS